MTRQKKEILKKIDEAYKDIEIDEFLMRGAGPAPAGFYDETYHYIDMLMEQLAHLRHFKSAEDMELDGRSCHLLYADDDPPLMFGQL